MSKVGNALHADACQGRCLKVSFVTNISIEDKYKFANNCRGGRVLELGFGLGIAASEVVSLTLFIHLSFCWIERVGLKDCWTTNVDIKYSRCLSVISYFG